MNHHAVFCYCSIFFFFVSSGIRRTQMAVPPTEAGDMAQQVLLWKRLLLYEKTSKTLETDPLLYIKRVRATFDSCLVVLRFYPEIWLDYANSILKVSAFFLCVIFFFFFRMSCSCFRLSRSRAIKKLPSRRAERFSCWLVRLFLEAL